MTKREQTVLVDAFYEPSYKQVGRWTFGFSFPNFFYYTHPSGKKVHFSPDHEEPDVLVIRSETPGEELVGYEIEFSSMNPEELFDLVKPFLETGPSRKAWDPRKGKK